MSGQATINVVDDEDMSSQGSINAPVVPPPATMQQGPTTMAVTEVVGVPAGWNPGATQQSGIARPSGVPSRTFLAQSMEVIASPTVPVDAPSCVETK